MNQTLLRGLPCPARAGISGAVWVGPGVVDIFDEVSEDLRADRARNLLKRYGYLLILAVILVILAVAAWQAWSWRQRQEREAVAMGFLNAMREANPPPGGAAQPRPGALDAFARIAADGPRGYRTLARFRAAALKVAAGDLPGALALWDQVSADTEADPQFRSLANLLWVQHQVDTGDPAAVQGRLAPLLAPGNPWRPLALECQAWLLLRTGETEQAKQILRQLVSAPAIPEGVRVRASAVLTRLGEPPPSQSTPTEAGG